MPRYVALFGALLVAGMPLSSSAQVAAPAPPATPMAAGVRVERPLPLAVVPPPGFQQAVAAGTRSPSGAPGPRYWQNWTDYQMRIRVLPETKRLEGSATLRYHNRAPDGTRGVVLDLIQNFHAPGAARMQEAEVTGGVEIRRVTANGVPITAGRPAPPTYEVHGTKMIVYLPDPLPSGGTVDLGIDWAFTIPQAGINGRMGHDDENLIFLAYFYPQMTVYDDVEGWHLDPFLGAAEFYSGFGTYDVTVEAPAGWLVAGTGRLTNPEQVLSPAVLARWRAAEGSDTVVHVARAADLENLTLRPAGGMLTWSFRADSVRDVAYSLTRESVWDAARVAIGDRTGDGRTEYARVDAIYRPRATRWVHVARYQQHALRFLSEYTGLPYPWPHMTAVEGAGIIGGGMEYPMMTLIGDYATAGDDALYDVTIHELAHMWMPMIVSTDERRYGWFDEGTTTFNENQGRRDFRPGVDPTVSDYTSYVNATPVEAEIMRRSDFHYPGPAFVVASYFKPALVLEALRGVLGEETFNRAYREFFRRWAFRHAYPWDFWNTFEDVSGRDLDWFWHSWYHETWVLDQAVADVESTPGATRITIADRGNVPMPVLLSVRLANGQELRREIPVDVWLDGSRTASTVVPGQAVEVQIDPERRFPDVDRDNNAWRR
jgi:hypothetical protein